MAQWLSNSAGLLVLKSGFRNLVSDADAVITGGAGKFYDDYPIILGSSRGKDCSQARANLAWAANPDATSFESGTDGGWVGGASVTPTNSLVWSGHGSRSLRCVVSDAAANRYVGKVAATATAAGSQYAMGALVYNPEAVSISFKPSFYDDVSGNQDGATVVIGAGQVGYLPMTATFGAGSTIRNVYVVRVTAAACTFYIDAIMLNAGSVPLPFVEKEALATNVTVPTPFAAGQAFSFVVAYWKPSAGAYYIFDTLSGVQYVRLHSDGTLLYLMTQDATVTWGAKSAATPSGGALHFVAGSIAPDNTKQMAIDGVLATASSGGGVRETAVGTTLSIGSRYDNTLPLNGTMLAAFWKRAMGSRELVTLSHRIMDSLGI